MSNLGHWSTLKALAERTGFSYWFLRKLVIEGKVKSVKSGVKCFVDEDSLAAYLDDMSGAGNE